MRSGSGAALAASIHRLHAGQRTLFVRGYALERDAQRGRHTERAAAGAAGRPPPATDMRRSRA